MNSTSFLRPSLVADTQSFRRSVAGRLMLCVGASVFVAACAHLSVPMALTPVPTTMQTFAVVLVGMLLGPVEGFAALTMYLAEAASGLPVLSPHGLGGLAQLLGPTGGYLFAYPLGAAIAGWSVTQLRRFVPVFPAAIAAGVIAMVPVFTMGATWLASYGHLSATAALHLAVTPFVGAEALKLSAAAAAYAGVAFGGRRS